MKNIFLLLSFVVCFNPCIAKKKNTDEKIVEWKAQAISPFVQTEDGKKIEAGSLKEMTKKIVINTITIDKKDITFFSDGRYTFCKIKKRDFSQKIADGDIELFASRNPYTYPSVAKSPNGLPEIGWGNGRGPSNGYYFHKAGKLELESFSYKTLKKYILPGTPGYTSLQRHRQRKIDCNLGMLGSVGLIVGCALIGGQTSTKPGSALVGISAIGSLTGIGSTIYFLIHKVNNANNLISAFNEHDGYQ